jgi:hypothetical protein
MQGSVKRLVEACGRPEQQRQRIDGLTGATATAERGGRGENAGHCRRRTSRRPSSQTGGDGVSSTFCMALMAHILFNEIADSIYDVCARAHRGVGGLLQLAVADGQLAQWGATQGVRGGS